jgi:hypothetical protein
MSLGSGSFVYYGSTLEGYSSITVFVSESCHLQCV